MIPRGFLPLFLAFALAFSVPLARAQTPAPGLFVVVLATATAPSQQVDPLPVALRGHQLYWRALQSGNSATYQLCVGFFDARSEAEQARRELVRSYPDARVITVQPRERDNVLRTVQKAGTSPAAAPPPALSAAAASTPAGSPDALMAAGRAAIGREDYAAAIRAFAQVVALPESAFSRDAQEFLALSYERRGDTARARIEYENYLKRYPEGEDASRVRQRLASLRPAPRNASLRAPSEAGAGWRSLVVGSLSQFYYRGNSKIDSQQMIANIPNQSTLSTTDQSSLITSVDLSARYLNEAHDNRVVVRDNWTVNFLDRDKDINRLNAAYYDYRYKPVDLSARLGRQPGNSGGMLGIFDGALLGYGLVPGLRVNLYGGEPVNPGFSIESERRFLGLSTDIGPFNERLTGSAYFLRQEVDGIVDREVGGLELRYFTPQGGLTSMVDYDTVFEHVNIATVQGNWIAPWKTMYNFVADYRMAPALQTTTAIIGEGTTSIRTLLQTYTEEALRERARALTAQTAFASAGFTHPLSRVWQLGANYNISRISHTDGTNNAPGTPGTGWIHTLSGQVIGTGLFATRDVSVVSVSGITGLDYRAYSGRVAARAPLDENWTLDASLFWYRQSNENGSDTERVSPNARLAYRLGRSVTLEFEGGVENSSNRSPIAEDKTRRTYYSLGYRWDL